MKNIFLCSIFFFFSPPAVSHSDVFDSLFILFVILNPNYVNFCPGQVNHSTVFAGENESKTFVICVVAKPGIDNRIDIDKTTVTKEKLAKDKILVTNDTPVTNETPVANELNKFNFTYNVTSTLDQYTSIFITVVNISRDYEGLFDIDIFTVGLSKTLRYTLFVQVQGCVMLCNMESSNKTITTNCNNPAVISFCVLAHPGLSPIALLNNISLEKGTVMDGLSWSFTSISDPNTYTLNVIAFNVSRAYQGSLTVSSLLGQQLALNYDFRPDSTRNIESCQSKGIICATTSTVIGVIAIAVTIVGCLTAALIITTKLRRTSSVSYVSFHKGQRQAKSSHFSYEDVDHELEKMCEDDSDVPDPLYCRVTQESKKYNTMLTETTGCDRIYEEVFDLALQERICSANRQITTAEGKSDLEMAMDRQEDSLRYSCGTDHDYAEIPDSKLCLLKSNFSATAAMPFSLHSNRTKTIPSCVLAEDEEIICSVKAPSDDNLSKPDGNVVHCKTTEVPIYSVVRKNKWKRPVSLGFDVLSNNSSWNTYVTYSSSEYPCSPTIVLPTSCLVQPVTKSAAASSLVESAMLPTFLNQETQTELIFKT